MNTPWTPGPWRTDAVGETIIAEIQGSDRWVSASVDMADPCSTCDADTELIALAPELAEAILVITEPCLECLEEDTGACGMGVFDECDHCRANADADVKAWNELHRLASRLRWIGGDASE